MSQIARRFTVPIVLNPVTDHCRIASCCTSLVMAFVAALALSGALFAQGEKPQDVYQSAWNEVSELLRRREYGSAIAKLESLAEERDLRDYGKRVEADKKAIGGLQVLERIVLEQAAKLEAGSTIEVSGIGYTVVRYEKSSKGDVLILKSKSLGKEAKKPIADLPSGTWMELAEVDLESLDNSALTLGIFLGFDRIADRKASRKLLNEAAAQGEDVTPWLARLDAQEARKKTVTDDSKGNRDPIIGKWSGWFGPADSAIPAVYEFRKNETGVMTIDPAVLAVIKEAPPGRDLGALKRLVQMASFTWKKDDDGTYRIVFKTLGSTFKGFSLADDTLQLPGYRPFVRQADNKK